MLKPTVFMLALFVNLSLACATTPARETDLQGINIRLIFGSHLTEPADAIVNSGNTSFEFNGGSSKVLKKFLWGQTEDGKDLEAYLQAKYLGQLSVGEAIVDDNPGKLGQKGFKYIVHIAAVKYGSRGGEGLRLIQESGNKFHPDTMGTEDSVRDSIVSALRESNKRRDIQSINIPAIAGSRGLKSKSVQVKLLKQAVERYLASLKSSTSNIKIINYVQYLPGPKKVKRAQFESQKAFEKAKANAKKENDKKNAKTKAEWMSAFSQYFN